MKGTCQGMCAKAEVAERQAQQDISFFEATEETRGLRRSARKMDPAKAVKRFRRAADGRGETPADIRPLLWLEKTMGHLWEVGLAVLVVVSSGSTSSSNSSGGGMSVSEVPQLVEVYDFLSDRFMAVRKDMVLQGLCGAGARSIYRRIVRFYILFDYLLTQQVPPIFDQHLGLNALKSGLATLFDFHKEANILSEQQASNKMKERNDAAAAEGSTHAHTPPEEHHHLDEFLAYHVLLQTHDVLVLGNSSGGNSNDVKGDMSGWEKLFLQLHRILGKIKLTAGEKKEGEEGEREKKQQQALCLPKTHFALDVATSLATANYARFYRLFRGGVGGGSGGGGGDTAAAETEAPITDLGTDVLLKCLLHKLLPAVRRRSLEVWSKTLFKKEKMYLEEVARLLCFEDMEQAAEFLGLYQLTVTREEVVGEENGEKGGGASSKRVYLEPRASSLRYLAQGQSLEERKATRAKLCKRQDADVLGGFASASLWTLWLMLGTL